MTKAVVTIFLLMFACILMNGVLDISHGEHISGTLFMAAGVLGAIATLIMAQRSNRDHERN